MTAHWSIKIIIWPFPSPADTTLPLQNIGRPVNGTPTMIQGWSRWKVVKWFTQLKYFKTVWFWLLLTLLEYIPLSRVSKCSSSNVITNEAYLLFFELSSWPKRWSFERLVAAVILRAFVINRILEIFSTCRILWYPPERYPQHFKFRESEKPLLQQSSKMQQHSDPKCQDKKWPCSGTYKHPGPKSFRPTNMSFVNFSAHFDDNFSLWRENVCWIPLHV